MPKELRKPVQKAGNVQWTVDAEPEALWLMPAFLSESVRFRPNGKWDEDYEVTHLGFSPPTDFGYPCTSIQQRKQSYKGNYGNYVHDTVIACNWTSGLGRPWHWLRILSVAATVQKLLQHQKLGERHSVLWRIFLSRKRVVRSWLCKLGILINGMTLPSFSAVFNVKEYRGKWQAVGMLPGGVIQYLCWRFGGYYLFLLLEPGVPAYSLWSVQCICFSCFHLSVISIEAFIYFKENRRAFYSICSIH